MKIKATCYFKNSKTAELFLEGMVETVKELNGTDYERINVNSPLGNTVVWGINTNQKELPAIVIFPGFRTCGMFWDLDNALQPLRKKHRIFLVDVNGQPCLSDGNVPSIKSNDYGVWAAHVIQELGLSRAIVMGASFGGLICLKLSLVAPHLVEKVILLNPGCLQPFSLSFMNLYYNMLPLLLPTRKNVETFLDNAVFYENDHTVSAEAKQIIIDYELFAITQHKDTAEKPYAMSESDLNAIKSDVYLILGNRDILFPYGKSVLRAKKSLRSLKEIYVVPNAGHGIETSKKAISIIDKILAEPSKDVNLSGSYARY